jgi:Ca2+:H+ antiporter
MLIIPSVALHNDQIRVVQASLLGSILVNLLLILGTAIIAGAVFQDGEQLHNRNEAQALACLLCVSVFSMMIPVGPNSGPRYWH